MFKISIVETHGHRKLVLEGKLMPPWTAEVEESWRSLRQQFQGEQLLIDLTNVTLISREGEQTLIQLMREGAKFAGKGVLTRHVLKELARRCRCNPAADDNFEPAQTTKKLSDGGEDVRQN
jgi:hypothetical protein